MESGKKKALRPDWSQKLLAETIQYIMEHFGDTMYRNCGAF
jgi:hypothetical protein